MDRREFLKASAITGASATLAGCGHPEHQLIRFIPEEELVPGVATWKPSICPLCPAGCGLLVRVMEGDAEVVRNGQIGLIKMGLAKKLEGNPAHPISQGKLCVRGQAAIQITYHPDRLRHPLKRTGPRGAGAFQEVTWDQAIDELASKVGALAEANNQGALAFWMRPSRGQRRELVAQFLHRFGAPPPFSFELFGEDVLRRANALSFGREQLPTFDLARTRYVISFGADFLGTWNSPVSQNIGYGLMRQGRPGQRAKLVQLEPRMSQTGANADEWLPIRPGTEGVLALGLAHVILNGRMRSADAAGRAGTLVDGWMNGLPDFTLPHVETLTGIAAARVERIARELAESAPAVAIIGGAPLAQTNGLFHALAVNALNALVGSVETPGGVFFTPIPNASSKPDAAGERERRRQSAAPTLDKLAAGILSAERPPIQILLLDEANPVFAAPPAWRVKDALQKIPFIASFGNFLDETSILADLILPDHSFLESWVDDVPEAGTTMAVASVAPPVMKALHQTRAMPDVLLDVARRLPRLNPPLPWQTFEQMLRASFEALPARAAPQTTPGTQPAVDVWSKAQEQGGWWAETPAGTRPPPNVATRDPGRPVSFVAARFDGETNEYPFHFLPYASQAFLDGSLAHLPWLQELPDVVTTAMWSSWAEINPKTAERLQIAQGNVVEIASRHGSLRAPVLLSPGIAPDVIAMPVGQGHEHYTRYATGRGANPISLLAPIVEEETGALAWAATRVRVSRVAGADLQLILFAGALRERPHEHEGR
ncbi:MAG: molybdopterin-dependent oxidoreductase [Acidobacteria bacterium]|nr:molybdopterin-dependent oxidoreductase [Acidobacteriota bacterium]